MSRSQKHIWDRTEIATRITQGQQLIIYRGRILNVTPWAPYHPGGALALLHFVGRDATNEIEAYHSDAAIEMMNKFTVARVDNGKKGWPPLTPPIALGLVRHLDGIKGHWAREGHVILGQTILQQSISLDPSSAPIPPVPNPNPPSPNPTVITLEPAQLEPPASAVDLEREEQRSEDYRQLKKRLVEAGLFKPPGPLAGYGTDIIRYTLFAFGAFYLYFK